MSIGRRIQDDLLEGDGKQRPTPKWYASTEEVWSFGRDMVKAGQFDAPANITEHRAREAASNLLDYFEKPWHWEREHAWWVASGRPDHEAAWEQGANMEWEVVT